MKKFPQGLAAFFAAQLFLVLPAACYSGEDFTVCHLDPAGDNYLSLRTCGSTRCAEIMRLKPGTIVTSLEPYAVRGWREVIVRRGLDDDYSGPRGWVFQKYICP